MSAAGKPQVSKDKPPSAYLEELKKEKADDRVIDEAEAKESSGSETWAEYVDVLDSLLLGDEKKYFEEMDTALAKNDHVALGKAGHAVKGGAAQMKLMALTRAASLLELLGKSLADSPNAELLKLRSGYVDGVKKEYKRVRDMLPVLQKKATEEEEADEPGDA